MNINENILILKNTIISNVNCGNKIPNLGTYENISQYSIWISLFFFIGYILIEKKNIKKILMIISLSSLMVWGYINFKIDYASLKKQIFAYNSMAEATLANIAEAQDRYKSEQGTYIGDLRKLYSHIGGAGGMNECVKILNVQAGFDHWRSEAKHLSSPDKVIWDSRAGTSLKKG